MKHFFFHYRLHLDPGSEAGGGGGSGSGGAGGEGGGSSGGPGAGGGSGAGDDAPISRKDFDALRTRYETLERTYQGERTQAQQRAEQEKERARIAAGGEPAPKQAPKRSDFPSTSEGLDQFLDAKADFRAEQKFDALMKDREGKQKNQQEKDSLQNRYRTGLQKHTERQKDAQGRYNDFDQVVSAAEAIKDSRVVIDILECDNSADVEYHYAKNPQQLATLLYTYQQDPAKGLRMLASLDARFSSEAKARENPQPEDSNRFVTRGVRNGNQGSKSNKAKSIARSAFGRLKQK